jgi:hypothetical protein
VKNAIMKAVFNVRRVMISLMESVFRNRGDLNIVRSFVGVVRSQVLVMNVKVDIP